MPLFWNSITLKSSVNEILDLQKIELCPIKLKKKKCMELDFREVEFQNAAIGL